MASNVSYLYVALLRGINVGGNNIIKMDDLRNLFVQLGFTSVKTYIQSGNVLFWSSEPDQLLLQRKIENALSKRFSYTATVIVRSHKDMVTVMQHFPPIFDDPSWKHNVIFVGKGVDTKKFFELYPIHESDESVSVIEGIIFWSAKIETLTRSTMLRLSAKKEYKEMTVRNINTTKKLIELMASESKLIGLKK